MKKQKIKLYILSNQKYFYYDIFNSYDEIYKEMKSQGMSKSRVIKALKNGKIKIVFDN